MILYLHIHCILQCHTVNCILQILRVLMCIILTYDMIYMYIYIQYISYCISLCMSYDEHVMLSIRFKIVIVYDCVV